MGGSGQMDFFDQLGLPLVEPAGPDLTLARKMSKCSANGLVHFKYNPRMKRSIRCKA